MMTVEQETELFINSLQLFNAEEFYECDEALTELLWPASDGEKGFYQGLIEVSGAFFRLRRDHYEGFFTLLGAGMQGLTSYSPVYKGIDVGLFLKQLHDFKEEIGAQLKARSAGVHALKIPKLTYLMH